MAMIGYPRFACLIDRLAPHPKIFVTEERDQHLTRLRVRGNQVKCHEIQSRGSTTSGGAGGLVSPQNFKLSSDGTRGARALSLNRANKNRWCGYRGGM